MPRHNNVVAEMLLCTKLVHHRCLIKCTNHPLAPKQLIQEWNWASLALIWNSPMPGAASAVVVDEVAAVADAFFGSP